MSPGLKNVDAALSKPVRSRPKLKQVNGSRLRAEVNARLATEGQPGAKDLPGAKRLNRESQLGWFWLRSVGESFHRVPSEFFNDCQTREPLVT